MRLGIATESGTALPERAYPDPDSPLVPVVVAHQELNSWKGLRRCLSQKDGFIVVPATQSPGHMLLQCQKLAPCVLILDEATLGSMEPSELAATTEYGRSIRVLVIGEKREERSVQNFVRMGCMGFIDQTASPALLKRAVRALARGEFWLERRAISRVIQQLLCSLNSQKLTAREREILRLIAAGYKNRAIAQSLSISHETVRWHIRSLHSKLGLQDRLGTALYAQMYLSDELSSGGSEKQAKVAAAADAGRTPLDS